MDDALDRPIGASRELITFVDDRPGHDFRYAMNFARIRDELGWTPSHTLDEGLQATVDWYLSHRDWLEAVQSDAYRDYYAQQYGGQLAAE